MIDKIHQTPKIIDLDPFKAQKLDKIAYFGSKSPLNDPGDPPVGGLKIFKLLKMVERCSI